MLHENSREGKIIKLVQYVQLLDPDTADYFVKAMRGYLGKTRLCPDVSPEIEKRAWRIVLDTIVEAGAKHSDFAMMESRVKWLCLLMRATCNLE